MNKKVGIFYIAYLQSQKMEIQWCYRNMKRRAQEQKMKKMDFLEPYEEECLFSWVVRMAEWYVGDSLSENAHFAIKKELFGDKASPYPYLHFEPYLSVLVERINLPQNKYFGSVETILNKMTIFPFYAAFYTKKQYSIAMEKLTRTSFDLWKEQILGLKVGSYDKENPFLQYKYCPLCMEESGRYLKREHQIPGNDICYKHRIRLRSVAYKKSWKHLNFNNLDITQEHVEEISGSADEIHYEVAKMIHEIFQKGFSESIEVTTAKIREKWRELGYLTAKNYFYDFFKLYEDFEFGYYFPSMEDAGIKVLRGIFNTKVKNKMEFVDYLFLIYQLFGSLEVFHQFHINEEAINDDIYPRRMQTKLFLEIKEGKKYLTTVEYAEKYGKERGQIRNYCEDGRFSNVVKIGDTWFIPEDALSKGRASHKEIRD